MMYNSVLQTKPMGQIQGQISYTPGPHVGDIQWMVSIGKELQNDRTEHMEKKQ